VTLQRIGAGGGAQERLRASCLSCRQLLFHHLAANGTFSLRIDMKPWL
jgi:hypothetical protein